MIMHIAFRLASALLYLGPFLAGMAGFGWGLVYGFLAIYLGWLFIVRRSLFPRSAAEWRDPARLTPLVTQAAVSLLLVVVIFALGRGLGGIVGITPNFSPLWTLAVSFLALPICRYLANRTDG